VRASVPTSRPILASFTHLDLPLVSPCNSSSRFEGRLDNVRNFDSLALRALEPYVLLFTTAYKLLLMFFRRWQRWLAHKQELHVNDRVAAEWMEADRDHEIDEEAAATGSIWMSWYGMFEHMGCEQGTCHHGRWLACGMWCMR
jgi:hypothetical protein